MDRIKRITSELLEKHGKKFSTNFEENKKTIDSLAIVRSKMLRNRLAGHITSKLRKESQEKANKIEEETVLETPEQD